MDIDSEVSIVGYTAVRPTFIKKSYKIGPLLADSEARIAEKLLKEVIRGAASVREPCSSCLSGRFFRESNMLINGLPDACFDKFLGDTSVG